MDSQLPKLKRVLTPCFVLVFCVLWTRPAWCGEVDLDWFGLTYHLHKKGAVYSAPLKLDRKGIAVFNPGVGIGYDFREDRRTNGFSPIIHAGVFENCINAPFTFAAAGLRYRKFINKTTFIETNVMAAITYGNDSGDKRYFWNPAPYANVGFGHDYGKYSITYYLSYVPQGSGGNITDGTDMLFASAAISF